MMAHIGLESARDLNSTGAVIGQLNSLLAPMGLMEKFITGIFLRIGADGLLRACNAGHPPLFIIPARDIEPMRLSEGGVPLGLFSEPPVPYSEQVYQLEVGDRFFLLTDGVIEWENPEGEQFGMDRVLEFLSNRRHDRISELLQGLMEELHQFSDRRPCGDDMTLFAFQYQGRIA